MRKFLLLVWFLGIVVGANAQSLDRAWQKSPNIQSAAWVEFENGRETGRQFFRRIPQGPPITDTTLFQAGSLGKTVIALALLREVAKGKLNLEDPLGKWLPQWAPENPWQKVVPVSIAHLLEHTSGMADLSHAEIYGSPNATLNQVLAIGSTHRRVRWRPGSRASYSNVGYTLLARVGEEVSGENWQDWLRQEVFVPLDMADSRFGEAGHFGKHYLHQPAMGFNTSIRDLASLVIALQLRDTSYLPLALWDRMEEIETALPNQMGLVDGYAKGIQIRVTDHWKWFYHTGRVEGYAAIFEFSRDLGTGYALLMQGDGMGPLWEEPLVQAAHGRVRARIRYPDPAGLVREGEALSPEAAGKYYLANPKTTLLAPWDRWNFGVELSREDDRWLLDGRPFRDLGDGKLAAIGADYTGLVVAKDSGGGWFLQHGKQYAERGAVWWRWCLWGGLGLYGMAGLLFLLLGFWGRGMPRLGLGLLMVSVPVVAVLGGWTLVQSDLATLGSLNVATLWIWGASCWVPLGTLLAFWRWWKVAGFFSPAWKRWLGWSVASGNIGLSALTLWAGWWNLALWVP